MARAMKLAALLFAALAASAEARSSGDTIAQVVSTLQGMLDKSKADGLAERALYAKYKCYCDDNEKTKSGSVEKLTKDIALLESEIEELKGTNGELSVEVAELKKAMDDNTAMQTQAETLRGKQKGEYDDLKKDLDAAIGQLGQAIDTLAAIGADQTLQSSAAHSQFMAGYDSEGASASLAILKTSISKAMTAADSLLSPEQRRLKAKVLLQVDAPFTGNYASQSGEIVGILKNMKETFEANLKTATEAEKQQVEAHKEFMKNKGEAYTKMETSFNGKQGDMGTNDNSLSTKTTALDTAETQKTDDEDFLSKLLPMCEEKAKDYEKRKMFRANEEAAIAKAIAILNSDRSADAFGKVKAGSGEAVGATSLVQIRRHVQQAPPASALRTEVAGILRNAAKAHKSVRLAKVASLLGLRKNPFSVVMTEIKKMKDLIDKEGKQDKKHLDWCNNERKVNNDHIKDKNTTMTGLEGDITQLEEDIDHPETGLKALIQIKEDDLETNTQSQTDETETRRTENAQYQESIANMVKSEELLEKAIEVLSQYYADLANQEIGFLQKKKADPAPPSTWSGDYAGQSQDGNTVISMLKGILTDSRTEQTTAHDAEATAQHDYEDSMQALVDDEADLRKEIVQLKKSLADAKEELEAKREELDQTFRDRRAIIRYLESIAPPCDFITEHFDTREGYRAEEKKALNTAETKLKGTPAFAAAAAADVKEERGACAETCEKNEAHVDCKACLADVSVPGYCAGHADTPGC